jgi:acylphosphatase
MREARSYRVSGRVQGVGFRYYTWDAAQREGLTGWVRNTPDGDVEVWAEGEIGALDRFEASVHRGPGGARVRNVDRDVQPATGEYHEFFIKG